MLDDTACCIVLLDPLKNFATGMPRHDEPSKSAMVPPAVSNFGDNESQEATPRFKTYRALASTMTVAEVSQLTTQGKPPPTFTPSRNFGDGSFNEKSLKDAANGQGRQADELMREVEAWIEAEMRRLDPQAYGPSA